MLQHVSGLGPAETRYTDITSETGKAKAEKPERISGNGVETGSGALEWNHKRTERKVKVESETVISGAERRHAYRRLELAYISSENASRNEATGSMFATAMRYRLTGLIEMFDIIFPEAGRNPEDILLDLEHDYKQGLFSW